MTTPGLMSPIGDCSDSVLGRMAYARPMLHARNVSFNNSEVNIIGRDQIIYDTGPHRRNIALWLSPLNFKESQSEFLQTHEQGTGNWLLESQIFQDWCNGTSQTLWCPGNPGTGKTILASIVVNYLQTFFNDGNVGTVFIYCSYKEQTSQTVTHLIASLLKQLVQDRPLISDNVNSFYDCHQTQSTYPTLNELTKALEAEIKTYARVFIVVDALDEFTESNESRIKLLKALRSITGPVNLMVTSRDLPSIEQHFLSAQRLDICATDEDVEKYVRSRLVDYPGLVNLRDTITKKIVHNVRGMFLLARLHMDALVQRHSEYQILRSLDNLQNEVDDIYDQAMERIERQPKADKDLAERVLSWIIYASRPLSVEELQHAVAVSPKMTELKPLALVFEWKLTSVCAGLVVIDKEQHIVRLAHYTTQQYFETHRELRLPHAEATIAKACLAYLSFDVFARGYCNSNDEFQSLLKENPLLDYASRNWGHHGRRHQDSIKDLAINFLRDDSKVACASQVMLTSSRHTRYFARNFSGVHMSAYCGLDQILRCQLRNGADADIPDSYGRTPLSYAAANGHDAVVKLLLARDDVGADSKALDGSTPLLYAAWCGNEVVVKLLLARDDVEVDSRDSYGRTPLSFAAEGGHEAIVELLLARDDIDANSQDADGRTPLSFAASRGNDAVVNPLLARDDVEPDLRDEDGRTPLSYAARNGYEAIVNMLLARDNVKSDFTAERYILAQP